MRLRTRLFAFNVTQAGLLGILFTLMLLFVRERSIPMLDASLARKARVAATSLGSQLDVVLAAGDTAVAKEVLAAHESDPDFLFVEVQDAEGRVFYRSGRLPTDEIGEYVSASSQISMEGLGLGSLLIGFSRDRIESLSWSLVVLSTFCLIAVGLASLFSARFAGAVVSPIHEMMHFSESVASGQLGERLRAQGSAELKLLAEHLNTMANSIEQRNIALTRRQKELEDALAVQATQSELIQSTRLAAVGEMAGRTAHEVLNPMTSIQARLSRMREETGDVDAYNAETLKAIVSGWRDEYGKGGLDGLMKSLAADMIVEEDLSILAGIHDYFESRRKSRSEDLAFLHSETERVVRIVDGMRNLARAKSSPELVSAGDVVQRALEVVRDSMVKRRIETSAEVVDALIYVDPHELIQVLTNLLRNSMQAVEEKSGRAGGKIVVSVAKNEEDRVEIRVSDTGSGIRPEHIPHLFEPTFTTRGARDGTGLGLSISRRFARQMHGDLDLESTEPGIGTTFILDLPLAEAEEQLRAAG